MTITKPKILYPRVAPSKQGNWLRQRLPARTRMQAGRTPMDCGLEVEAIGYVPQLWPRG